MKHVKIIDCNDSDSYSHLVGKKFEILDTVVRYKVKDTNGNIYWVDSKHCDSPYYKCAACGKRVVEISAPVMGKNLMCLTCGQLWNEDEVEEV